jgi:broad specificity phosphatase PhoE
MTTTKDYRLYIMTRLFLVRHGQSEWNALGKWQGQADPPLTKLGEEQALQVASVLPPFVLLASSNLQRAMQTAKIFAQRQDWDNNNLVIEERLQERDAGAFSGLTRVEIDEQFPGYLGNDIWPDDWEPEDVLLKRLLAGLDELVALTTKTTINSSGDVVVVTHGGCIYALESLFGESYERIPNLSGRWFEINNGDIKIGERTHLLNQKEQTSPDPFTI